jgi:hypothetical protein
MELWRIAANIFNKQPRTRNKGFSSSLGVERGADKLHLKKLMRKTIEPSRRWVVNIRMDLGEVGWGDVDWIGLPQDNNRWRGFGNSVLNLRVP